MSDRFVLWQIDFAGRPCCTVISHRGDPPVLSEKEMKTKICDPIKIEDKDASLSLQHLVRLYPFKPQINEEQSDAKRFKPSTD